MQAMFSFSLADLGAAVADWLQTPLDKTAAPVEVALTNSRRVDFDGH
jgi:hypothetical protein